MPEFSAEIWMMAVLASIAVGLSKGGLSMVATLAVPLLSLVMSPVQAAGLLLPVFIISDMGGLLAFRRNFDAAVLRTALPGAIAGIAVGWATAHIVPDWGVTLIVGVIGLIFALNALFRPNFSGIRRRPSVMKGSFWAGLPVIPASSAIPERRLTRSMSSLCICLH